MDDALAAVVLAGGKSTRFGSDKAAAMLGGEPLLQWIVGAVGRVTDSIVVVKARGQQLPAIDLRVGTYRVVEDFVDGRGPLAGLVAGLRASRRPLVFATACDAPLLQPALVGALARMVDRYDAVVPEVGGRVQPLVAVYRLSTCLPAFERSLSNGELRLTSALRHIDVRTINESAVAGFDTELESFMNANEPGALEVIAQRLGERGGAWLRTREGMAMGSRVAVDTPTSHPHDRR